MKLCSSCFRQSVEDKVRRTISKRRMLKPNDHVAVAVSGGKDSLTLLSILKKLETRFPRARLTAVTVDEGIHGYRDEALRLASDLCSKLGVDLVAVSFEELYGITTDELVSRERKLTPCSYCGVFRRKAINYGAAKARATKIATAHNLDDEVQTVLLNLLHGDVFRLARASPVLEDPRGRFLPRIKPLCEVPEREVALYAYLSGLEFQSNACPHGDEALRGDIRTMLNRLEEKHPGMKFTLFHSAEKLRALLENAVPWKELRTCQRCGDPTSQEICEGCKMLESVVGPQMPV